MAPVATEAPNVETYGELLKKLKEAASDQVDLNKKIEPVPDFVKAQHVNYIMGYVFLVFVLQTGSVCGEYTIDYHNPLSPPNGMRKRGHILGQIDSRICTIESNQAKIRFSTLRHNPASIKKKKNRILLYNPLYYCFQKKKV